MTEQSLREAVVALRKDLAECYPGRAPYDIPSTTIDRLDALLAAHPVEPAATCSACGHTHTADGCSGDRTSSDRWAGVSPSVCDCDAVPVQVGITDDVTFQAMRVFDSKSGYSKLERLRAVLEHVAPLLGPRPQSRPVEELVGVLTDPNWGKPLLDREKVKDAVFFNVEKISIGDSGKAADAVMELARPMPTREQIAIALYNDDQKYFMTKAGWPAAPGIQKATFLARADAVLVLLKGAES